MLEWHVVFIQPLTFIFPIKNRPFLLSPPMKNLSTSELGQLVAELRVGIVHTVTDRRRRAPEIEPWACDLGCGAT
jgi:hypothetical protein